jgi:hypothetical protein
MLVVAMACRNETRVNSKPSSKIGYLKGQTHVHSSHSGDSTTPVADVAEWYASRGFDFIVMTDHNFISNGQSDSLLIIPGVELTQNLKTCDPPPTTEMGCLLHMNALFVDVNSDQPVDVRQDGTVSRADLYLRALEFTNKLGGIAQLNHPNMAWAANEDLIDVLVHKGVKLMEIANQNEQQSNQGDPSHPSTEALWDRILSRGSLVYGMATDDAHHYNDAARLRAQGQEVFVGNLGWIMVHARRQAADIRRAIVAGDFYSTTGVMLSRIETTATNFEIEVDSNNSAPPYTIDVIGNGGRVLQRVTGTAMTYKLADAPAGYLRATVTDSTGHRAWVQPFKVTR